MECDASEFLKSSIKNYNLQLSQVKHTISATPPGPEKEELESLQSSIEQLIELTKENISKLQTSSSKSLETVTSEDKFEDEYALFKSVIETMDNSEAKSEDKNEHSPETSQTSIEPVISNHILDDLNSLKGTKCQAPHTNSYDGTTYHNAIICDVDADEDIQSIDQIQVRVLFVNPTHRDMLPCPNYFEGTCQFLDYACWYSHGEIVQFSNLKEYREPDFSLVSRGCKALVKDVDDLWHHATVENTCGANQWEVKFNTNSKTIIVDLHHILPLGNDNDTYSDSEDSCEDEFIVSEANEVEAMVQNSLMNPPLSTALGKWECHPKGIGSRLMAQMGYITGTGLGKFGEGRLEPIEAVVLPAGKSLDHCMNLKEQAGGDSDLFRVERKLKRIKRNFELKRLKINNQEKKSNIFDFLNMNLGSSKDKTLRHVSSTSKNNAIPLRSRTNQNLKVEGFRINENIRRAERDLERLQEALSRHYDESSAYSNLLKKFNEASRELDRLKSSAKAIDTECNNRKDCEKMYVF